MIASAVSMSENAFINHPNEPTDEELTAALGAARALWDNLLAQLAGDYELVTRDWHSYSRKSGWSLRVRRKDRNIVYLLLGTGEFQAAFMLGDKAIAAARQDKLPQRTLRTIDEARRYAEGTGVRVAVNRPADIAVVKKLVAAKLAH